MTKYQKRRSRDAQTNKRNMDKGNVKTGIVQYSVGKYNQEGEHK